MDRGRSIHDLGTIRLSWLEFRAFLEHAPSTAAFRKLKDPLSPFKTPDGLMLSAAADALAGANWQRGGGKGPRPLPLLDRVKQQMDKARQDLHAPQSAEHMANIREELKARRKRSKDIPRSG